MDVDFRFSSVVLNHASCVISLPGRIIHWRGAVPAGQTQDTSSGHGSEVGLEYVFPGIHTPCESATNATSLETSPIGLKFYRCSLIKSFKGWCRVFVFLLLELTLLVLSVRISNVY